MTEDEQSGTLAFLQNFYTGVTLYMPTSDEELPVANAPAVALPEPTVVAKSVAVVPPAAATKPVAPLPTAAAARLPTAASAALPPLPAPMPASQPTAAALPPLPASTSAAVSSPSLASPAPAAVAALPPLPIPKPVSPPLATTSGPAAPASGAVPPAASATPPVAPYLLTTFDTLGSNPAGVVLLVRLAPEQFVKLPRNVFLNKLLQAIGLVMADVVLVNVAGSYPVALVNLRKEIDATTILAFGKNLLDVAVRTTQIYEPVQFPAVGLAYLAGAEIEMIEYDVSLKKRLWGGLQRMFPK
ncbi:MAG: hypothetical protein ACRYG7_31705 [Janthinobacterium lividum]